MSNFLPLQCNYARLYTLDELFNDVRDEAIEEGILDSFERTKRMYGEKHCAVVVKRLVRDRKAACSDPVAPTE